ncbi:MAG: glycosyltransferase [Spirochaetaceae bacterium]|nr:glycosyltransferase [Spirochaetaceae bacterium]
MNLCAVVVWYNPNQQAVENILKYCKLCAQVYIVDNSDGDNSSLAKDIPNGKYFANLQNKGIAAALNEGCKFALQDGFHWCMTMDQDSSWEEDVLIQFFSEIKNYQREKRVSFAPTHTNEIKSLVGDVKYAVKGTCKAEINFPDKVMTSGNIINLTIWEAIGKFNEGLFIDEVDHEFCYRLWENGYEVCEFPKILMSHTLGYVKRTILPRPCKHSGVRLYYIFRNMLYIKQHYPKFYKRNGYKKYMIVAVFQKLLEFKWRDLVFIKKGINAAKKCELGSYRG